MAIEVIHIYPYSNSNQFVNGLSLPLRNYKDSQLAITNIEGIAPVAANVNITPYAGLDGGVFNSSRRDTRNIVITMKLFNKPSMDTVRQKVFNACPIGKPVTVVCDWSDGVSKAIDGIVEDTPVDYFGRTEGIQISIICPNPDFRVVEKTEESYTDVINYKRMKYPSKETEGSGEQITTSWYPNCRDATKKHSISSGITITNNTNTKQDYLFAVGIPLDTKELYVSFFTRDTEFNIEAVLDLSSVETAEWIPDTYYYETENGYYPIETETHFNYLTQEYSHLTAAVPFEEGIYYKDKPGSKEPGKWIPVTWVANYTDELDPTLYDYPVIYGYLTNNKVSGQIVNSIVSMFRSGGSYFTTPEKMFAILSKSGVNLTTSVTFEDGMYYKLKRTYSLKNGKGGYTPVLDTDDIFFVGEQPLPYMDSETTFHTQALYGFSGIKKVYAVYGTVYVADRYYYISGEDEILLTSATAPSDWQSAVNKYYRKDEYFYDLDNYTNNTIIGGRLIHDVILDFITYKYENIESGTQYEEGIFYEYVGIATKQVNGIYGFNNIPIYKKVTGPVPSDWEISDKYYQRIKKTVLERDYQLYYNDHAFSNIVNRSVKEYEILTEQPEDWVDNFASYYTLENDYSNITAYFIPDAYTDYSKIYSLLTEEPEDFSSNYSKYYVKTTFYSNILKRIGPSMNKRIIPNPNEYNAKAIISFKYDKESNKTNYLLGNVNGNITKFVWKSKSDVYYPGEYYSYDHASSSYILLTQQAPPVDFYSDSFKYYKKIISVCDYIPGLTIIFYNPVTRRLEYDRDQYDMFCNDFENWVDHVTSPILYFEASEIGNRKNIRKNNFTTYFASGDLIFSGTPTLDIGNNVIISYTVSKEGIINYDYTRIIGIAAQIT